MWFHNEYRKVRILRLCITSSIHAACSSATSINTAWIRKTNSSKREAHLKAGSQLGSYFPQSSPRFHCKDCSFNDVYRETGWEQNEPHRLYRWNIVPLIIKGNGTHTNHLCTASLIITFHMLQDALWTFKQVINRLHWSRVLRHEPPSPARTLESCVRIPLKAWMSFCVYSVFVLFCVQVWALQRTDHSSKESYRLCIGLRSWKKRPRSKGL
jgi:hypothetical protein